jgi:hypothetical protein
MPRCTATNPQNEPLMPLYAVPFACERSRTSYAIRKTLNVKRYTLYAGVNSLRLTYDV